MGLRWEAVRRPCRLPCPGGLVRDARSASFWNNGLQPLMNTVQLHTQTVDVTEADRKHATKLYQIAQEGMRSGLYISNCGSFLCSRRYCSFWARCVDEYGGEVD
jgi:hypothetical protein